MKMIILTNDNTEIIFNNNENVVKSFHLPEAGISNI